MEAKHPDEHGLERYEIIDGVIYDMTPPPSERHQGIVWNLSLQIGNFLVGKTCRAYSSPFAVYFNEDDSEWVESDITIVCDPSKLRSKGCVGTPDMVIEVLSPNTAAKDRKIKLRRYQRAGVREYWIVDPLYKTVEVFRLEENVFGLPEVYEVVDKVNVGIFEDLQINLQDVFY